MSSNHDYALNYPAAEGRHWPKSLPMALIGAVVLGLAAVLILESSPVWLALAGVVSVLALALHDRGVAASGGVDSAVHAFGRTGTSWDGGCCRASGEASVSRELRHPRVVDGGSFERAR